MEATEKVAPFLKKAATIVSKKRLFTDPIRRLAWGTDAGFYRQIPKVVIFPSNETEVSLLLKNACEHHTPVTFRAAGTSLSGQSISDSVLIITGKLWEKHNVHDNGSTISLQPGIIGSRVNDILKPFGRIFSPDPASLNSAMVGGIIINNASGKSCGTHANSDKILRSARIIFADGTLLDTGDKQSRKAFQESHPQFLEDLLQIRTDILSDEELVNRIHYKYSIKNVTGLNILPFVTYDDPFDIIAHLLVGSEGTLAFLAEATVDTEIELPCKASAMVYFTDIKTACQAVIALKKSPVTGVELLDRKALLSVIDKEGIPDYLPDLTEDITALLIETKAETSVLLQENITKITASIDTFDTVLPILFTDKEEEYAIWWNIRSGIFPSVGGMRELGTTTLIEDVAFHIDDLPEATSELQAILLKHGYYDGVIYGHALEGNFHFIINQRFDTQNEIDRYEALINDVIALVTDKYDGSLKAEHGTGRNMAPFVEREWGTKAFSMMKRVKTLFDPTGILNPGVIFNDDPKCHIKNFKPLPLTNSNVDKCIECGFCEVNCLTAGFVLSSRQRIVIRREISRLERSGENPVLKKQLEVGYSYLGNATCAGDGLCATSCPMGINTGNLTHDIRHDLLPQGSLGWRVGNFAANHFSEIKTGLRSVLTLANFAHTVIGSKSMTFLCNEANKMGLPLWTTAMPKSHKIRPDRIQQKPSELKVVYFPSCINQSMGVPKESPEQTPLSDKMIALLNKAGYEVIFPKGMESLCCGTIWESKGMYDIADRKTTELETSLWEASEKGRYPVLCDQSPCLYRMREKISKMKLYEPVEFIEKYLVKRLVFSPINEAVAIHTTCSMTKMHLQTSLLRLAKRCSSQVFIPQEVGCCGFAGDKGFTTPEVNRYALRKLRPQLEEAHIQRGYSNSRTCEIGLTTNSGIPYMSIVYLVDRCTRPIKHPLVSEK
jgi:D-lactate dehydrogenase